MKDVARVGTVGEERFVVSEQHLVDFAHDGMSRILCVCSGQTGLHASGNWSTWSPARFPIPNDDENLVPIREEAFAAWSERPELPGGGMQSPITYGKTKRDVTLTCGNCMHVCHPDPEERKRRLKLLEQGGVIIQLEDGKLEAVSPEEAKEHIAEMEPERRGLYETLHPEDFDAKQYSCLRHHSQYGKETGS